jgi:hypothetical protein
MKSISRIETIREISIRNEIPFNQAMSDYTKVYCKVYRRNSFSTSPLPYGHPDLEDKIFDLTEKYITIKKWKELKKYESM